MSDQSKRVRGVFCRMCMKEASVVVVDGDVDQADRLLAIVEENHRGECAGIVNTRPCEVYLGDCVWPGHLLAVASSPEEADRLGAMWAARYGVPFHPLDRERLNPEADERFDTKDEEGVTK